MAKKRLENYPASGVDLLFECSSSAVPAETPYNANSVAARTGQAQHKGIEHTILGEGPTAEALAATYDCNVDDIRRAVAAAVAALAEIREPTGVVETEVPINAGLVRCRVDALSLVRTAAGLSNATAIDWKGGRLRVPKPGQLLANASAIRAKYGMPSSGYIYTAEVWLQDREIIERRPDKDRLDAFDDRLRDALAHVGRGYSPGPHCVFCAHHLTCEASAEYLRSSATALADISPAELSPEVLADLWPRSRALKQAIAKYEAVITDLLAREGEIPLADGTRLTTRTKNKMKILPRAAWPVMKAHGLSDSEIANVISVGKGKLVAAVSDKAPRGKKKHAVSDLLADLRKSSAVVETTYTEKYHDRG